MDKGLLLTGQDNIILSRARRYGLEVVPTSVVPTSIESGPGTELPFAKTLLVAPGTRVPWQLLDAAWNLLDGWDAAVPLWQYTVTAEMAGTAPERERTRSVIRDLRVLLHATELLFVRADELGRALVQRWFQERMDGGDDRLAFLRALHIVKPRLFILPTSWLSQPTPTPRPPLPREDLISAPFVKVEIAPGQFVKCRPGDEGRVREMVRRRRTALPRRR